MQKKVTTFYNFSIKKQPQYVKRISKALTFKLPVPILKNN